MINENADEFKTMLEATMSIYNSEVDVNVLRIWWSSLARFDFKIVKEAFSRHIQDPEKGAFTPKPANIIAIIESLNPDGRLGAEEAWALYPHNEKSSAVITDEMAEAMGIAYPLIQDGDKVGARMAFKEAYNRIAANNKMNGIAPKWFASLGHDVDGREPVLKQAVAIGRLPQAQMDKLLPYKFDEKTTNAFSELRLLTSVDLTDEEKEKGKSRMAEIKKVFLKND